MANIAALLKRIESGTLSYEEKLSALSQVEQSLQDMRQKKQEAIQSNVMLIVDALKQMQVKVEQQLEEAKAIVPQKGQKGDKGDKGDRGLDGAPGKDGRNGIDGKDGKDGNDGISVTDAKIDFDGSLVITLSNGREINVGEVLPLEVSDKIKVIANGGGTSQTVVDTLTSLQNQINTLTGVDGVLGDMAQQNANNVAITGGAIDGATIGGVTPAAGTFTTLTATGQTSLGGVAGSESLRVLTPSVVGARLDIQSFAGSTQLSGEASTGVVDVVLNSRSSGSVRFRTAGGTEQARVSHTASAVNYVQVTGAATSGTPTIDAAGSDATLALTLRGKGSNGSVSLGTTFGTNFRAVGYSGATVVNYLQAQASATTLSPVLSAQGTDTNISQVFQSKGTGAIDLAAGSSGVNISNGGTVTAITRTSGGTLYTSVPTIALSAPTTAGGVQATASITISLNSITAIVSGGTGYTVNDTLTVVGGTGTAIVLTVSTVSAGVITAVTISNFGSYSVAPSNPMTVTGGTGTGATFTPNFGVQPTINITNAGSGYVEQPTVSFSGGGGSGAAAYAIVGSGTVVRSLGNVLDFYTPNQQIGFRISDYSGSASTGYWNAYGGNTTPVLRAVGSTSAQIGTASAVPMQFITNTSSEQLRVSHTASAVNYVQVTGAATGATGSTLSAQGSDASTGLNYQTKGDAYHRFYSSGGNIHFRIYSPSAVTAANYIQVTGSTTTNAPVLSAQGTDTNIGLVLQPKGTGALQAQQTDSTTTGGNARGANAVDWQTYTRTAASQVASGLASSILGGARNTASNVAAVVVNGTDNTASGSNTFVGGGSTNSSSLNYTAVVGGYGNTAGGIYSFIGAGYVNSGTSASAVTTQSGTMNGTTAVTLSGSNASIKVGQYITGTSIASDTYVAAISGTSLTLSKAASGSSTSTLSFYTPHGVVVGGGNNQATGAYSFIGGGGDAGTAANRNVASGDWSVVAGGKGNTASGIGSVVAGGGVAPTGVTSANTSSGVSSFVGSGQSNTTSGNNSFVGSGIANLSNSAQSAILGGTYGSTRSISGSMVFPAQNQVFSIQGSCQSGLLILARQTTDATATVLCSDGNAASTINQVILPNNSAYYFRGEIVAGVTGGGDTKGWYIEGVIKRGANAASTALVGTATVTSNYADAGASTWTVAVTADTTNGGLAVTVTGQASTTIRWVAQIRTTEMTY